MGANYDFKGYATRYNRRCSDGRTIRNGAFKDMDGKKVPLVWNHQHNSPDMVVGYAVLEHRDGKGAYAYGYLNNTELGQTCKEIINHGDVVAMSIYANQLKENKGSGEVYHGNIREVSLVLAGANPDAYIDTVVQHSDDQDEEAEIYYGEDGEIELYHADKEPEEDPPKKEEKPVASEGKTVKEVFDTLNEEQKKVVYYLIGQAAEGKGGRPSNDDDDEEEEMKHNAFEGEGYYGTDDNLVISHSDQVAILKDAKGAAGTFRKALESYAGDYLEHGFEDIEALFPEWEDTNKGTPETLKRDLSWVGTVMNGVHKAPYTRVRTRLADARMKELRAKGYIKGDKKTVSGMIKLLQRTTDPQTIYRKDSLERDDIVDITDFDIVQYQFGIMRENLEEDIALAILVGDDREDTDREQIKPEHIRPIWTDDDLYTIKVDVDYDAEKELLQGSDTEKYFSDEFVYARAMKKAILFAKEKYKGSGNLVMFCTPHFVNQMLLATDRDGHDMYPDEGKLRAALGVSAIHTVEQLEGKTRTTEDNKTKRFVALLVNLNDYQVGHTKGGEITKFQQFDIDFNQEKMMLETRLSGALIKPFAAIAIEEDITGDQH